MLTENKNISIKDKSKKGFTLVELIIVVTILAILATIAFISFQGYSKNSRDANRLASLNNIKKGLDIYYTKSATLPSPENPVPIYYSGTLIGQQGYFGDNISRLTGFNKIPLDSLDNTKFTYSVNSDLNKFQALALMETSDYLSFGDNIISKSYAANDYSSRFPKTIGDNLGILLGSGGTNLNRPIQEYYTGTLVDLKTNTGFTAIINNSKSIYGDSLATLKNTLKNGLDNSLIGYWDMDSNNLYMSGTTYYNYTKNLSGNNGTDCSIQANSTVPTNVVTGVIGDALTSTGVVNIKCSGNISNSPYSISWYYKINSLAYTSGLSQTGAGIFQLGSLPLAGLSMYILSNNLYVDNSLNGGTVSTIITNQNVNIGSWNSIIITYDGGTYNIYNNGILIYSIQSSTLLVDNSLFLSRGIQIKTTTTGNAIASDIAVDELKIYNKILNNNEIQNLYNQVK